MRTCGAIFAKARPVQPLQDVLGRHFLGRIPHTRVWQSPGAGGLREWDVDVRLL